MKLALFSDLHFSATCPRSDRHGQFADIFLTRLVRRLNRFIRPDATLIMGDLLDDPNAPDAGERLQALRRILDTLTMPWLALPGNHDPAPERFYSCLPDPRPWVDISGVRLVPFFDEDRPGFNGFRPPHEQARLAAARANFGGPLVCLQHMSLHVPDRLDCPYNLTNAPEVLADMARHSVTLCVSGHHHEGALDLDAPVPLVILPALCKTPLSFLTVDINARHPPTVTRHSLSVPPEYRLVDYHVHSPLAYCSENMDCGKAVELAHLFGLGGMAFTEHTSHLYLRRTDLKFSLYQTVPFDAMPAEKIADRAGDYWHLIDPLRSDFVRTGLEADLMFDGRPFVRTSDWQKADIRIGAIHQLPSLTNQGVGNCEKIEDEYLAVVKGLAGSGMRILAHPFRIFRRGLKVEPPARLFEPVCRLLKAHGIAAEINFHANEPSAEFVALCLKEGVKLTLGSDSHNLCEVGDFQASLDLLSSLGVTGDPSDVLNQQPPAAGGC